MFIYVVTPEGQGSLIVGNNAFPLIPERAIPSDRDLKLAHLADIDMEIIIDEAAREKKEGDLSKFIKQVDDSLSDFLGQVDDKLFEFFFYKNFASYMKIQPGYNIHFGAYLKWDVEKEELQYIIQRIDSRDMDMTLLFISLDDYIENVHYDIDSQTISFPLEALLKQKCVEEISFQCDDLVTYITHIEGISSEEIGMFYQALLSAPEEFAQLLPEILQEEERENVENNLYIMSALTQIAREVSADIIARDSNLKLNLEAIEVATQADADKRGVILDKASSLFMKLHEHLTPLVVAYYEHLGSLEEEELDLSIYFNTQQFKNAAVLNSFHNAILVKQPPKDEDDEGGDGAEILMTGDQDEESACDEIVSENSPKAIILEMLQILDDLYTTSPMIAEVINCFCAAQEFKVKIYLTGESYTAKAYYNAINKSLNLYLESVQNVEDLATIALHEMTHAVMHFLAGFKDLESTNPYFDEEQKENFSTIFEEFINKVKGIERFFGEEDEDSIHPAIEFFSCVPIIYSKEQYHSEAIAYFFQAVAASAIRQAKGIELPEIQREEMRIIEEILPRKEVADAPFRKYVDDIVVPQMHFALEASALGQITIYDGE